MKRMERIGRVMFVGLGRRKRKGTGARTFGGEAWANGAEDERWFKMPEL